MEYIRKWFSTLRGQIKVVANWIRNRVTTKPLQSLVLFLVVIVFLWILRETYEADNLGLEQTLWEWLKLLLVPALLAIGGFWLDRIQANRDAARLEREKNQERARQKTARLQEEIRQDAEKARQIDNQHQATLQHYFDKMSELLMGRKFSKSDVALLADDLSLEERLKVKAERQKRDMVEAIAQARTMAVLRSLDPNRVSAVFRFLVQAKAYGFDFIHVGGEDLEGVNWSGVVLKKIDLTAAHLKNSDLSKANLDSVNLRYADLRKADLRGATIFNLNLEGTQLERALCNIPNGKLAEMGAYYIGYGSQLENAWLRRVNLSDADLKAANLKGAHLEGANLSNANLSRAILHDAELLVANLSGADLNGAFYNKATKWPDNFDYKNKGAIGPEANLREARFMGADLTIADFCGADLSEAKLFAANLAGATYDNATKFPRDFDPEAEGMVKETTT